MSMGIAGEIHVMGWDWFRIHFTENKGMAFGMSFGGDYGKIALSLFRIIAIGFIGYYIRKLIQKKASFGLLACIAMIFAGALGNILDSAFYGLIFSESNYNTVATVVPFGDGYAPFLYGKVVDMFYFPMYEGTFPSWFPFWGGQDFTFFSGIFNIADAAISLGVFFIILYHKRFFKDLNDKDKQDEENSPVLEAATAVASAGTVPETTNNVSNIVADPVDEANAENGTPNVDSADLGTEPLNTRSDQTSKETDNP